MFDQEATDTGFVVGFSLFPVIGYLMATRRPENSLGWLMLGIGTAIGLTSLLGLYALRGPRRDRRRTPD